VNRFQLIVAYKTLNLLIEQRALLYTGRKAYWVWKIADRVLVIFDPAMVDLSKLNDNFAHRLSTRLQGRLVVRTNSRGMFLQVDSEIPPTPLELSEKPLNLSDQPSPYHIPIGMTGRGDLWLSLLEADSIFVTGMRGMGKTGLLHGAIQALLAGGATEIYAWDGKENAEYLRYVGQPKFTLFPMGGLQTGLENIQEIATLRLRKMAMSGHPNIVAYNAQADPKDIMLPMALVIDEVAEVQDQSLLLKQVKVNRAAGLYPIFATNDPSKSSVIAKSNLGTRISFKVISPSDSYSAMGQTGANKLPAIRGRGLIVDKGELVEFQSFRVDYPPLSEAGKKWLEEQLTAITQEEHAPATSDEPPNEIVLLAESIRARWTPGMSKSAVSRLFGKSLTGTVWCDKVTAIVEYLSSTSTSVTSTPEKGLILPDFGAVTG
jgi:hypothetical protein